MPHRDKMSSSSQNIIFGLRKFTVARHIDATSFFQDAGMSDHSIIHRTILKPRLLRGKGVHSLPTRQDTAMVTKPINYRR